MARRGTTARAVLVVDDDPLHRYILSQAVQARFDGQALEASRGDQALDLLRGLPADTDVLIVSDYHMPGMDGATFLAACQGVGPREQTRFLVTGAVPEPGLRCLSKPAHICQYDDLVLHMLQVWDAHAEHRPAKKLVFA